MNNKNKWKKIIKSRKTTFIAHIRLEVFLKYHNNEKDKWEKRQRKNVEDLGQSNTIFKLES